MDTRRGHRPATLTAFCLLLCMTLAIIASACSPAEETQNDPAGSAPSGAGESGEGGAMTLASPAFDNGEAMPLRFARAGADGDDVSPPYEWTGAPEDARSFALVVHDAAPIADGWLHWVVTALPPEAMSIPEGASGTDAMPPGSVEHLNTFGDPGWGGPQPPAGSGVHEYFATLYALDVDEVVLPEGSTLEQVRDAVADHVIAEATYVGTFER